LNISVLQINFPSVQGADDAVAGNNSVGQWSAAMRAPILNRQKSIAQIEYRNRAITDDNFAAFA